MEKIKRFIECLVPITLCNMKCSYCYIIQDERRSEEKALFKYEPKHIGEALSKERLGGTCYISICGAGETLIPEELPSIVFEILKQGHYVNITTNGTLTHRIEEILTFPKEYLERINFSFSFHYLELKRLKKMEVFFENLKRVKKNGCSFVLQLNLCDEYIPYLKEIKEISEKEIGTLPQLAATRNQRNNTMELETLKSVDEYKEIGNSFMSPLFKFTMENFMVERNEFCYAGDWSAILNLGTGEMRKCYDFPKTQNIFENIEKEIKFEAVGVKNCKPYCINSSHFLSLGTIPSLKTPTYEELRNKNNWYNERMSSFLSGKLIDNNDEYSELKKGVIQLKTNSILSLKRFKRKKREFFRKLKK